MAEEEERRYSRDVLLQAWLHMPASVAQGDDLDMGPAADASQWQAFYGSLENAWRRPATGSTQRSECSGVVPPDGSELVQEEPAPLRRRPLLTSGEDVALAWKEQMVRAGLVGSSTRAELLDAFNGWIAGESLALPAKCKCTFASVMWWLRHKGFEAYWVREQQAPPKMVGGGGGGGGGWEASSSTSVGDQASSESAAEEQRRARPNHDLAVVAEAAMAWKEQMDRAGLRGQTREQLLRAYIAHSEEHPFAPRVNFGAVMWWLRGNGFAGYGRWSNYVPFNKGEGAGAQPAESVAAARCQVQASGGVSTPLGEAQDRPGLWAPPAGEAGWAVYVQPETNQRWWCHEASGRWFFEGDPVIRTTNS